MSKYFQTHCVLDMQTQNILESFGIPKLNEESPAPPLKVNEYGFGYQEDMPTQEASGTAYMQEKDGTRYVYIVLQVGSNAQMITQCITKICNRIAIQQVIHVGTCLGLSTNLQKYDIVKSDRAYCYVSGVAMLKNICVQKSVILTGNIFVSVSKRRKLGYEGTDILPDEAKYIVQELINNYQDISIVLDMESAFIYEALQNVDSSPKFELVRIVLDTLEDLRPINYRKDIKACSKLLCDEVLGFLRQ